MSDKTQLGIIFPNRASCKGPALSILLLPLSDAGFFVALAALKLLDSACAFPSFGIKGVCTGYTGIDFEVRW